MLCVFNAIKMHSSFIIDSALNKPFNTSYYSGLRIQTENNIDALKKRDQNTTLCNVFF